MNAKRDTVNPAAATSAKHGGKKPYQKPSFRHERVFEQSALACGKVQQTQSGCSFNRKTS
ncbi:MAG TPA: hypothetical protein VLT85_13140 [Terriglobales bacterium]|nr:hypothetical protein [Terriglobales bacterium]